MRYTGTVTDEIFYLDMKKECNSYGEFVSKVFPKAGDDLAMKEELACRKYLKECRYHGC